MNEGYLLGPEFWAGVIGAVVGAIASGVISWFLQHS